MRALLTGRQADARAGADRVLALGREAGDPAAWDRYLILRYRVVLEWGSDGELDELLDQCREQAYWGDDLRWRGALTLLLSHLGKTDEATRELDITLQRGRAAGLGAATWVDVTTDLVEAAALLPDAGGAVAVARSSPWPVSGLVVAGRAEVCKGSIHRYRGIAAAAAGAWRSADHHFGVAAETHRSLRAVPLVAERAELRRPAEAGVATVAPVSGPSPVDATAAGAAVGSAAGRLNALLRSAAHPSAPTLGDWDTVDVAVHVSHAIDAVTASARGSGPLLDDVWDLSTVNGILVGGETERDLGAIADRIEASAAAFVGVVGDGDGDALRPWLVRGVQMPLSALTCQVLNELTVHGRDIAVAQGAPWSIERRDAALVLLGYLFPALDALGRSMVDQDAAAGVRACYEVRLRGGGRAFLRFHDGDLSVRSQPPAPVDCHLSVDPETFLLVSWGRLHQWPAIGRGRLLAWGRRPWLGLKLREMLRNP